MKILLIDDNAAFGKFFVDILRKKGHDAHLLIDEASADTFTEQNDSCDLILLDYQLGNTYSDKLAEKLRERYLHCQIILTSGNPPSKNVISTMIKQKTIDEFIEKPFSFSVIEERMNNIRSYSQGEFQM